MFHKKKSKKKSIALVIMAFVLFVSCSKEDSTDTIVDGNPISNNKKATGSSSHDLLSGDIYKSMVIELVYVQGFEPSATAINNFFFECQIQ
jgi:major membrane immunogen (membrane-anchored lipoprotein)